MGSSGSVLGKNRVDMNLNHFALFLLLVLTVNGAPKPDPKPSPKAAPNPMPKPAAKAKAQMAIIFNNKKNGATGNHMDEYGYEYAYDNGYGEDATAIGKGNMYDDDHG